MTNNNNNDDNSKTSADDIFLQALDDTLSGVKPLKKTGRVLLKKTAAASPQNVQQKKIAQQAAVKDNSLGNNQALPTSISDDYIEWLKPTDVLAFKRAGIQEGVYRKFRLGKYVIDGRLDLHRKTVAEARSEVASFIGEAMQYELRTVLILHGKGERSIERQAVIKSHVAKWLKEVPEVLAYHSAQPQHGGTGAVYVMLRKSEKAKEKAREEYTKRG